MAVELATLEYKRDIELAKAVVGGTFVAPLASYVICNAELLDAIAEKEISPEKIRQLVETKDKVLSAFPRPQSE